MGERIGGFLSNDSTFGKIMIRIGTIISANILFCIASLPIFTIGAAYSALYYVMFKMLRESDGINPFKEFWKGFQSNFKQATQCWIGMLLLVGIGYLDVFWCSQLGGILVGFQYMIYTMGIAMFIIALYVFPTMAAFENSIIELMKSSLYFAFHKPLYLCIIAFITVFPQLFTFANTEMLPLYGFIWVTCGYALIVLLGAKLLLSQYVPYLSSAVIKDK